MDSTYAPSLGPSRWRTATIVVSLLAVVELLALLAIGVSVFGKSFVSQVETAAVQKAAGMPERQRAIPAGRPKLTRASTGVLVLNGGGVAGAAGVAAERVRAFGYRVGGVGNASTQGATRTVVMYRDGFRAEAARLAKDLRVSLVSPLDGMKPSELMGANLALVVGR